MKQVSFPISLTTILCASAFFAGSALAQAPAAAPAEPAKAAEAAKADAKPCDGKKGDCPDCDARACNGCGSCCDDDEDDCDACEGCAHKGEGKPCGDCKGEGKPCGDCKGEGKPCDGGDKAEGKPCGDCKGEGRPCDGGDKAEGKPCGGEHGCEHGGEHHGHGGSFGGLFGGWGAAIRPQALIQTQIGLIAGADNQIANGDVVESAGNFILRRARIGVAGHISERITWVLSSDLADIAKGNSPVHDASMSLHFLKHQDVTAGAQLIPFSHFAMIGSGDQALAQRPKAVDAMAPMHQIGVSLHGHYDIGGLQWWAGAYNSFERNASSYYGGIAENSWLFLGANGNRARGYSLAGRIQAEPLGSVSEQAAGRNNHEKFKFEIGAGGYYNDAGATSQWAVSADVHLKSHGAHLMFEYLMDSAAPKSQPTVDSLIPDTLKRQAMIAELGYTWWRFNAAARLELIDPNTTLQDNRDQIIVSGALGAQLTQNRARVQLQYDHREERYGPALKNDTIFAQFQVKL